MPTARRLLTVAVLSFSVGASVAACGDSSDGGAGGGGAAAGSGSGAGAGSGTTGPGQDQAEAALLTATEMPLGFSQQEASDATALGCAGIDALYLPAGSTGLASVSFAHSINDVFLNETVSVRPGVAAEALSKFAAATRECRTFTGAQGTSYKVTGVPGLGRYGDGSAAVRISTGLREGRPVDLVAVRVGDLVLVLANATSGTVDGELTRTLVERAVAKARKNS